MVHVQAVRNGGVPVLGQVSHDGRSVWRVGEHILQDLLEHALRKIQLQTDLYCDEHDGTGLHPGLRLPRLVPRDLRLCSLHPDVLIWSCVFNRPLVVHLPIWNGAW